MRALLLDRWKGDIRRTHAEADDVRQVERLLQEFPGIGPTGAAIFCREVQGSGRTSRPTSTTGPVAGRSGWDCRTVTDLPRLVAGCVRASLDAAVVRDVTDG